MEVKTKNGVPLKVLIVDTNIKLYEYGLKATITVYADNISIAETVAYVCFDRMRDVLSLENDIPIQLYKHEVVLLIEM